MGAGHEPRDILGKGNPLATSLLQWAGRSRRTFLPLDFGEGPPQQTLLPRANFNLILSHSTPPSL